MLRPDASGLLVKWAVELGEFNIEYQSNTAIKARVLADFVVELTCETEQQGKGGWLLHIDGSSTSNAGGAEILLQGPEGVEIEVAVRYNFPTINNEVEYEALIIGLQMALEVDVKQLDVCTDSQLVAMQIEGSYEIRELSMMRYLRKVRDLIVKFDKCIIQQVRRGENTRADALSMFGIMIIGVKERKITVIVRDRSLIEEVEAIQCVEEKRSWKSEIEEYLVHGFVPTDPVAAKRLKFRVNRFTMLKGELYRRTTEGLLLKYLRPEKANYVLREIHEGSCGNHSRGRLLAEKVTRQWYFWPTIVKDAMEFTKKCESCQRYASLIHSSATPMEPIKIACPFDRWGIDIVGPFPPASVQKKFIIVAVEYFSKWVEAEAL
ncbi:UNVERIFIED_CONTAM: hypothetical protein Sangu_0384800 [Sesamum angustifolium]|uniref:RNase H type-1 domain-containing protein n=1 Tax=Sesamum angustifolium TaxID=2727405 RepID=A0AAW2QSS7_9LAMI